MARDSRSSRRGAPPDAESIREALREVRAIYADLEARPIERDCRSRTECCRFRLTGRTPQLTRGEALVSAAGWRAVGRKALPEEEPADGACPFLASDGRCGIYRDRPFGCRTHFCAAAGGVVDRAAILDLIRRLETIDESLRGDGPKPLRKAVEEVWDLSAKTGRKR